MKLVQKGVEDATASAQQYTADKRQIWYTILKLRKRFLMHSHHDTRAAKL